MNVYNYKYFKELGACSWGLANFNKYYPKFEGTLSAVLELDKIPYNDKAWVVVRETPIPILIEWAMLCAETQLHIFEKQYPKDTRVRDCINTIKNIKDFSNITQEELDKLNKAYKDCDAAYDATRAAAKAAYSACSAAYSACSAACCAAWAARNKANNTANNAARNKVMTAINAASNAAYNNTDKTFIDSSEARARQDKVNMKILVTLLKNKEL